MRSERLLGGPLGNGLAVRLLRRPHLGTVNLGLFVGHGSCHEDRRSNGISHYIEHVLWNPRHMPEPAKSQLYRLLESGARYEAYTSKEYTRFMVTCLPEALGLALETMGVVMREREVRAEAVEHERSVILHEHAMSFTSARIIFNEVLDHSLWGDESLGLFVIGRRENIERFDAFDLDDCLRRCYLPERSCLMIVGPLEEGPLMERAGASFAGWERGSGEWDEPAARAEPRMLSIPQRSSRVDLLFGFPGPGSLSPERFALEILADILGAGWKSRLFLALREGRKLAYLVRAYTVVYKQGGYIGVQVNCESQDAPEVFAVLDGEIRRLGRDGVRAEEVERAKAGKKMVLLDTVDTNGKYLQLLGRRALLGEDFDPERELAGFLGVRPEEVTRLARQILSLESAAVVARGPEAAELERLCAPVGCAAQGAGGALKS